MEIVTRNDVPAQDASAHQHAMLENQYRLAMEKCRVPGHLHDGLSDYLVHRIPTGSFLRAVLDNNLRLAVNRGDEESVAGLANIVRFLVNWGPMAAWGSEELVDAWLAQRTR